MLIMVKETMAKMIKNISIAILAITATICVATVTKNVVSTAKNVNNTLNDVRNCATSQIGDIRNDVKEVLNTNLNEVIKYLITPQSAVINEPIDTSPENSVDSLDINSPLTLDNLSPDLFQYVLLPGQQINHKIYDQAPLEKLASNLFKPAMNSLTNEAKELMNNIVNDENNPLRKEVLAIANENLKNLVMEVSKIITEEDNPTRKELLEILSDEQIHDLVNHTHLTLDNGNALMHNINNFLINNPRKIKTVMLAIKHFTPSEKANINNNNSQANANNVENKLSNINDNILDNGLDSNKNEEPAKKGLFASVISFFSSTNNNSVV